jgi:uncharacterized protein YfaS (alpha-2-macroglobulin family)
LTASGPLAVDGPATTTIEPGSPGEHDLAFQMQAAPRTGPATVRVVASAKGRDSLTEIELPVRPANPYLYDGREVVLEPESSSEIEIPALGLEGTRRAQVRISATPGLTFSHRLARLVRYPYGCLEQTLSAVFPQLYLKDILSTFEGDDGEDQGRTIDRNIDAGIRRLRRFRAPEGGFATWPGGSEADLWSTNYAGHFLIEARRVGHHVPEDLSRSWLTFQNRMAAREAGDLRTRAYRLYLLALAGDPATGAMNLMKEEHLESLDPLSSWLLAAAYDLGGLEAASRQVLARAGTEVPAYRERGGTYGSTLRDTAMILYLATALEQEATALELFGEVNAALGTRGYLTTHETAFSLLGVGSYLRHTWDADAPVRGRLITSGDPRERRFDHTGAAVTFDLTESVGTTVRLHSESSARLYAAFEWEGIPIEPIAEPVAENLNLEVRWLDEDGRNLDPSRLAQGTVFWCHLRVASRHESRVENVALTQILPSGWEIDATRLRGEALPDWTRGWRLERETYLDIRDDRAMWFFDLGREPLDFMVKLLAVTRGRFVLAPASAEAMYDHQFRALVPGTQVEVVAAEKR